MRTLATTSAVLLLLLGACASRQKAPRPTLALPTTDGDVVSLEQLRGKVVLVNFFATWCFPCMVEVPELKRLQQTYGPRGFEVVAVGMDLEGAKVLAPFAKSYEVNYRVLVADTDVRDGATPFGRISQLPSNVVLNRDGTVALAFAGVVEPKVLEKVIDKLTK